MLRCKDFEEYGIDCCVGCHYEQEHLDVGLITILVNAQKAYVCCELANLFYPDGAWKTASPTGGWADEQG